MRGISLNGAARGRWTLDHEGHRLEVETERVGPRRTVRLYVDGERTEEAAAFHQATLPFGGLNVNVAFDMLGLVDGQAARCELAPPKPEGDTKAGKKSGDGDEGQGEDGAQGGKGGKRVGVPFAPPLGTRAAKREELARKHPELYASRHVVLATGKVLFGLLGIGALIRLLISLVPWPSVRLPDIDPPSVPWPDVPWPDVPVPDVTLPAWLSAVLATTKFWVPILIAAVIAVREAKRRRRQREAQAEERSGTQAAVQSGAQADVEAGTPADAQDAQAEEVRSDRH